MFANPAITFATPDPARTKTLSTPSEGSLTVLDRDPSARILSSLSKACSGEGTEGVTFMQVTTSGTSVMLRHDPRLDLLTNTITVTPTDL